ncbi:alpha-glucosidase family protein [Stappia stellulata]|uniref:alpha-glucosidase n=1 Tax=Stappia stellulata TaxID=71235 RepID=UPI001CD613DD|nr:alpha-glucosidase [Stappia stellulata]MCA1243355.1 alpha-glucosidase family protein [Stappia stellulata]
MLPLSVTDPATAPRPATDPDWWRSAVIYQIYPRSFYDTDGNGIGDLAGITAKLDHVESLGVDAIWISPFYPSPMDDFGYDVSNFTDVDPIFGTLEDFDRLIAAAHDRGLKVIIDLVISHTSDRHPWFQQSRASRDNARADWFVWADPRADGTPPNNWLSIFGGSAWAWDSRRRQYYLHNFLASQPDLNFHNVEVQDAVLDAARFWLERGVDGFRLDTVNFYFHDPKLRDNPPLPPGKPISGVERSNPYSYQDHIHDKTQPENLAFLERLRALTDSYPHATMVGEIGSDHDPFGTTAAYTQADKRLHMAYGFDLLTTDSSAAHIRRTVRAMEAGIGSGWPSWAVSNHDVPRVATRWGGMHPPEAFAPLIVALVTSLRGTPCLYQGEELGLKEAEVAFEHLQDPYGKEFWPEFRGRDGCRTPMPWDDEAPHTGFSQVSAWLPIPDDHRARSVKRQEADPASPLHRTRRFLAWRRKQPELLAGDITLLDTDEPVLAFLRVLDGRELLCAFNLGDTEACVRLDGITQAHARNAPDFSGEIEIDGEAALLRLAPFDALYAQVCRSAD